MERKAAELATRTDAYNALESEKVELFKKHEETLAKLVNKTSAKIEEEKGELEVVVEHNTNTIADQTATLEAKQNEVAEAETAIAEKTAALDTDVEELQGRVDQSTEKFLVEKERLDTKKAGVDEELDALRK
jgi:hypothetical protein